MGKQKQFSNSNQLQDEAILSNLLNLSEKNYQGSLLILDILNRQALFNKLDEEQLISFCIYIENHLKKKTNTHEMMHLGNLYFLICIAEQDHQKTATQLLKLKGHVTFYLPRR